MSTTASRTSIFRGLSFLLIAIPSTRSQGVCDTTPTFWDDLVQAIDENFGIVFLCPFTITGDNCPPTAFTGLAVESDIVLLCEPRYTRLEREGCVIDCPGTHFDVMPNGYLFLDGMTLQGATTSSINVDGEATLTVYNSIFESNFNEDNSGGVINAKRDSFVEIMSSRFQNNRGQFGGGIFHLGDAYVDNSVFLDNTATEGGGGAIYTGSDATITLKQNMFAGNTALFGPAAFDSSGTSTLQQGNSGCGNVFTDGSPSCDGVASLQSGVTSCDEFSIECIAPTSSPTSSPSHFPSATPSAVLSQLPTASPTMNPSLAPTVAPSPQPTGSPTMDPSKAPSHGPSFSPSETPSFPPSRTLTSPPSSHPTSSLSMRPSLAPSLRASSLPTTTISENPSDKPSGSTLPSLYPTSNLTPSSLPSSVPSSIPSFIPSLIPSSIPSSSVSLPTHNEEAATTTSSKRINSD